MLRLIPVFVLALVLAAASHTEAGEGAGLAPEVEALRADVVTVLKDLPEKRLEEIRRAPKRFVEDAADLIYGFGEAGALGPEGLDRFIAIARAQVRAREMRRLLLADLDDDGRVSRDEIGSLIAAEAATSRGRLELAFRAADRADGAPPDGWVDLGEMRAYASAVAEDEIDAGDARLIRSILLFDLDGDGAVTLDEIIDGVDALTAPV